MARRDRVPILALVPILVAALAGCGTDGGTPTPDMPAGETSTPATTTAPPEIGADGVLTVRGVEYAFEGVPAELPRGTTLAFENAGREYHEMIVVRRNPGVEESFDELLDMAPGEVEDRITVLGGPIAAPGTRADEEVAVATPGEYLLICFIPVGSVEAPGGVGSPEPASPGPDAPGATGGDETPTALGPPHSARGMLTTFTVVP